MNNGGALNSTAINGSRGDVSVRIQVLAYARAVGVATGHVLRRSLVIGVAQATGTGGRVWRRSVAAGQALAVASGAALVWRRVFSPGASVAQAQVGYVSTVFVRHLQRSLIDGRASATANASWRIHARLRVAGQAQASAVATARTRSRSVVAGQARAEARIIINVDRQLPFDESAPEQRTFIVPKGTHLFYVVS